MEGQFLLELSRPKGDFSVVTTYSLRQQYGFRANRPGEAIVEQLRIVSIGDLIDALRPFAALTENEIDTLHKAYLDHRPEVDIRQRIGLVPASYNWGMGSIDFGPFSGVRNSHMVKFLGTLGQFGVIIKTAEPIWQDELDARRHIIVFHETVHLQQDLCTGLGAWDSQFFLDAARAELTNKNWSPESCSHFMLYGGSLSENEYRESFVREEIEKAFGSRWDELFPNLTTESLLETEAVATTLLHLFDSELSQSDQVFCTANADVYDPEQLGEAYSSVLRRILGFVSWLDFFHEPYDLRIRGYLLTIFLCDLCFAVPAPPFVKKAGGVPWQFDPRLVLMRITRGIFSFDRARKKRFGIALMQGDFQRMFDLLAAAVFADGFFLVPLPQAYASWVDYFQGSNISAFARLRLRMLERRVTKPFATMIKNLGLESLPPFFSYTDGYRHRFMSMPDLTEPEIAGLKGEERVKVLKMQDAIISREQSELRMVAGLVELKRYRKAYRCPFVASPHCQSWTGACLTGLTSPDHMPLEGCDARVALSSLSQRATSGE